jgi:DNA polymerase-1
MLPIGVDTETLGTTKETNIPVYFSWSSRDPLVGSGAGPTTTAAGRDFLAQIAASSNTKVIHNMCFDVSVLIRNGFEVNGTIHDTILAHALLDEYHKQGHSLDSLSWEYLKSERKHVHAAAMLAARQETGWFGDVPQEIIHPYCLGDSDDMMDLYYIFIEELKKQGLWEVYLSDCAAEEVYRKINDTGVLMDVDAIKSTQKRLVGVLKPLKEQLFEAVGIRWNPNSAPQNSKVLSTFLPLRELTDGGKEVKQMGGDPGNAYFKTSKEILQQFVEDKRVQLMLGCKAITKAEQTMRGYLKHIQPDGRMYPNYRQTTNTGRAACSKPSLQQIPKQRGKITEVEVGSKELAEECAEAFRQTRKVFIAPKGKVLVACDYKQVEYRAFAHYSGSERMIKELKAGEDFHKMICELVFDHYDARMRHIVKIPNYGLIYGMGDTLLRKQLALSGAWDGKTDVLALYEQRVPEMRSTQKAIVRVGEQRGFVRDVFGRRYRLAEDEPYKLVSYLCQGTAANIKKKALPRCDKILQQSKDSFIVMDIHDELVFEMSLEDLHLLYPIHEAMENFPEFDVPILTDIAVGVNFLEMQELESVEDAINYATNLLKGI